MLANVVSAIIFTLWCFLVVLIWCQPVTALIVGTPMMLLSILDIFHPDLQHPLSIVLSLGMALSWVGALVVLVKRHSTMKRVVSRAVSHGAPLQDDLAHYVLGQIDMVTVGRRSIVTVAVVLLAGVVASGMYMSHVIEQRNQAQWKLASITAVGESTVTVAQDNGGTCTVSVVESHTVGDWVPTLISESWCEITTQGEYHDPTFAVAILCAVFLFGLLGFRSWYVTPRRVHRIVTQGVATQCVGAVDGRRFPLPGVRWGRMPLMTISVPWNHAEVTAPRSPYLMPGGLDGGHHAVIQAVALTKACGWSHGLRIFLNELAADAKPSAATPHKETASIFLMDPKNPRRGVLLYRTGEIFWVNLVLAQQR